MAETQQTEPNLVMFNTITGFREAMTFIGMSSDSDDRKVHIETFENEEDGLVYMRMTSDHGVSVLIDATLKSKCLDSDAYVNLNDLYVICDKGVKEGILAMWTAKNRLYIGSSFNEDFEGFEVESSLPMLEPFETDDEFTPSTVIEIPQDSMAILTDSIYTYTEIEMQRNEGLVSFRTGDERVIIATVVNTIAQANPGDTRDFAFSLPVSVFKLIPMVRTAATCLVEIDFEHGKIRVAGKLYSIQYKYNQAKLKSGTTEGMTEYMKFDTLSMMATIDMVYGVNYKDPIAPAKIYPVDEKTVAFEFGFKGRYKCTITMPGVKMVEQKKSIVMPMDVCTMMVRNAGSNVLSLLTADDGRLFMTYRGKAFARKCMYFGEPKKKKGKKN